MKWCGIEVLPVGKMEVEAMGKLCVEVEAMGKLCVKLI
jgi:hypothetical protein